MATLACPLCSSLVPAEELEDHVREELSYDAFRCGLCRLSFCTYRAALYHYHKRRFASHLWSQRKSWRTTSGRSSPTTPSAAASAVSPSAPTGLPSTTTTSGGSRLISGPSGRAGGPRPGGALIRRLPLLPLPSLLLHLPGRPLPLPQAEVRVSSLVPAEELEDHVREELSYDAFRCGLCRLSFCTYRGALYHYHKRRSPHPDATPRIIERTDGELERRLDELMDKALGQAAQRPAPPPAPLPPTAASEVPEAVLEAQRQTAELSFTPESPPKMQPPLSPQRSELLEFLCSPARSGSFEQHIESSAKIESIIISEDLEPSESLNASSEPSLASLLPGEEPSKPQNHHHTSLKDDASKDTGIRMTAADESCDSASRSNPASSLTKQESEDSGMELCQYEDVKTNEDESELPEEVLGFQPEPSTSPLKGQTKKVVPRRAKLLCVICKTRVGYSYKLEHLSTKHLREAIWSCTKCSYTNQHWGDTIGLKEHLERKHQTPVLPDFKRHFQAHHERFLQPMKEWLRRCYPDSSQCIPNGLKNFGTYQNMELSSSLADISGSTNLPSDDWVTCEPCQKPVSQTELRNHVLLEHIKAPGFRCSLCGLKVPYWKAEFKQMGRHAETRHPGQGLWQTLFEDLRRPLYPQLRAFLRQCFGLEARSEAQEVNRIKLGIASKMLDSERRLGKRRLAEEAKAEESESPGPTEVVEEERVPKKRLLPRCKCLQPIPSESSLRKDDLVQLHLWKFHGHFAKYHRHRCVVCGIGLSLGQARDHFSRAHRSGAAIGGAPWRSSVQDLATKEELAELGRLQAENISGLKEEDASAYESLGKAGRSRISRRLSRPAVLPLTPEQITRIQASDQTWQSCGLCSLLICRSERRRHVLEDHLAVAAFSCRLCGKTFGAVYKRSLRAPLQEHLKSEHNVHVDLLRMTSVRETNRKYTKKSDKWRQSNELPNTWRKCYGDEPFLDYSEHATAGLIRPLRRDEWPKDLPSPR